MAPSFTFLWNQFLSWIESLSVVRKTNRVLLEIRLGEWAAEEVLGYTWLSDVQASIQEMWPYRRNTFCTSGQEMTAAVKMLFSIVTRRSSTKPLNDNHASFFSMVTLSSGSRACKASNDTSTSPEKSSFRNADSFHTEKPDQGIHSFPLPGRSSHLLQCHPCFYYFLFFIFVKNYIRAKYINLRTL